MLDGLFKAGLWQANVVSAIGCAQARLRQAMSSGTRPGGRSTAASGDSARVKTDHACNIKIPSMHADVDCAGDPAGSALLNRETKHRAPDVRLWSVSGGIASSPPFRGAGRRVGHAAPEATLADVRVLAGSNWLKPHMTTAARPSWGSTPLCNQWRAGTPRTVGSTRACALAAQWPQPLKIGATANQPTLGCNTPSIRGGRSAMTRPAHRPRGAHMRSLTEPVARHCARAPCGRCVRAPPTL